jgi:hypothetical protein
MKYKFNYVPDPEGEGFVKMFLKGTSKFNPTTWYYLEIDFNLDCPREKWVLTEHYIGIDNGIAKDRSLVNTVYSGKELTEEQRDMMVELVLDIEDIDL